MLLYHLLIHIKIADWRNLEGQIRQRSRSSTTQTTRKKNVAFEVLQVQASHGHGLGLLEALSGLLRVRHRQGISGHPRQGMQSGECSN